MTHCPCSSNQQVTSSDGGQADKSNRWAAITLVSFQNPFLTPTLFPREAYSTSSEGWAVHLGMRTCAHQLDFMEVVWPAEPLLGRKELLIALPCLRSIMGTGACLRWKQHARQTCRPLWKLQQLG